MNYYSAACELRNKHSQKVALANMYHKLFTEGTVKAIKVEVDQPNDTVVK
jgi:hypothetical protein